MYLLVDIKKVKATSCYTNKSLFSVNIGYECFICNAIKHIESTLSNNVKNVVSSSVYNRLKYLCSVWKVMTSR